MTTVAPINIIQEPQIRNSMFSSLFSFFDFGIFGRNITKAKATVDGVKTGVQVLKSAKSVKSTLMGLKNAVMWGSRLLKVGGVASGAGTFGVTAIAGLAAGFVLDFVVDKCFDAAVGTNSGSLALA